MKMYINKILRLTTLAIILCAFVGCSDDLLDLVNQNEMDAELFFDKLDNFDLAMNSVYSAVKGHDLYGAEYLPKVLYGRGHTADQDWVGNVDWNRFYQDEVVPEDKLLQVTWKGWWRVVGRANDLIENVEKYIDENDPAQEVQNRLNLMKGQALFLRAFSYYNMINLWGEAGDPAMAQGVPIVRNTPKNREEMMISRDNVSNVHDFIIEDLEHAEVILPESWPDEDIARADAWAVRGLLAKVYLLKNDMSSARNALEEIINESGLTLVPGNEYDALFRGTNEFSDESLFEINYSVDMTENVWQGGLGSNIALIIAPRGTGWSNVHPHDENIRRFGSDPRLKVCALEPGVDTVVLGNGDETVLEKFPKADLGWSFRKYVPLDNSVYSTNSNHGANIIIMRMADMYLHYAEVLNALNEDPMALEYVNKVRRRAYGFDPELPNMAVDWEGLSGTQLRDSIREERFRELFGEGHRWFDVKRWRIADSEAQRYGQVVSGAIQFDAPKDYALPIPLNELEKNTAMNQTSGY